MARIGREGRRYEDVRSFIGELYGPDLHAKRIDSLAGATLGVMTAASLAVSIIGQALAQARGLDKARHQAGRPAAQQSGRRRMGHVRPLGDRDGRPAPHDRRRHGLDRLRRDDQTTLALNLVTNHGRATPLLWLTVFKGELKDKRNDYEDLCLLRLAEALPEGAVVTILADRGFGDVKLFAFLDELGFDYVIRFRGNIHVAAADGETRLAADWVGKGGRARKIPAASVTAGGREVGAVVCVHAKDMKEAWCLATSHAEASARQIINSYAKRWTIEPGFRDTKDLRFGMGMGVLRIADPQRRDRLLLLNAFAIVLLTLLGAAGESLGMDRHLKSNTAKHRTHSLFRQGCMLYELIPTMPEHRLLPLMRKFNEAVSTAGAFGTALCSGEMRGWVRSTGQRRLRQNLPWRYRRAQ